MTPHGLRPDQEGQILLHNGAALVRPDGVAITQSGTGNTHVVTAGSTTGVFTNTTFDGSTGSTAYTVGDIVKALKTLGLLAP